MKTFKQALKYGAVLATVAAGSAHAAVDLAPITGAFTATDVITAVLAIGLVLATIYATMFAAKMALKWIKGG
jgi:hypothetical protein